MEILFNQQLVTLEDKALEDENNKPVTLKKIVLNALVATYPGEENLAGDEKLKRWELALKIKNEPDPVSLKAEEVTEIKKLIAKMYGTLVVGQAFKMLDN